MDLMKGSTSFRSLRKKYDDFSAPSVEVTVGSIQILRNLQIRSRSGNRLRSHLDM